MRLQIGAGKGDLALQTPPVAITLNYVHYVVRNLPGLLFIAHVLNCLGTLFQKYNLISANFVQEQGIEEDFRAQILKRVLRGLGRFIGWADNEFIQRRNRELKGLTVTDHIEGAAADDWQLAEDVQHVGIFFEDIALNLLNVCNLSFFRAAE